MINASIHRKSFNAYFIDAASFTHDALTVEGRDLKNGSKTRTLCPIGHPVFCTGPRIRGKLLERSIPGQAHAHPALSPDGLMVTLCGPSFSRTTSLDVQIWILTVNGKRPPASVLAPFLSGKITVEPNPSVDEMP